MDEIHVPDERITAYLMQSGFQPGDTVDATILRAAFSMMAADAVKACESVAVRYPLRPSVHAAPTHGDHIIRQSRTVAESCAAAVRERLTHG